MSATADQARRSAAERVEREMLSRLGLTGRASRQDIETARDDVVRYLEAAPQGLRGWAHHQAALVDEAYALLSDPATDFAMSADGGLLAVPRGAVPATDEVEPGGAFPPDPVAPRRRRGPLTRVIAAAVAVVGVVTLAYVVYAAGSPAVPGFTGTPAPEASGRGIDTARVATLMAQIQSNPADSAALAELGDIYFTAGEYQTASDWMTRVLAIDPKDVTAMIGLGAARFNLGDTAGAEAQWRAALAVAPDSQEAYFDLGYLYLSENPPDMAQVRAMWGRVIEIDPATKMAQTAQTHLASLASASPGAAASSR